MKILKDSNENTKQSYKQLYLYFYITTYLYSTPIKNIQLLHKNCSHQMGAIISSCYDRKRERTLKKKKVFLSYKLRQNSNIDNYNVILLRIASSPPWKINSLAAWINYGLLYMATVTLSTQYFEYTEFTVTYVNTGYLFGSSFFFLRRVHTETCSRNLCSNLLMFKIIMLYKIGWAPVVG